MDLDSEVADWVRKTRLPLTSLDSAYNSDESPPLISSSRCGSCRIIPSDARLLPCGHSFCLPCSTSCSPEYSLTLYCPLCGDQSIAPYEEELNPYFAQKRADQRSGMDEQKNRISELEKGSDLEKGSSTSDGQKGSPNLDDQGHRIADQDDQQSGPSALEGRIRRIDDRGHDSDSHRSSRNPHFEHSSRQVAKDAWNRLQIFSEASRRRIDDLDSQRRFHSPTRSSDTFSNIEELEELEDSLSAVNSLLQRRDNLDRNKRILNDLRNHENRLKSAISRLNSPDSFADRSEQWRRSFADIKSVLRTLSTRAKLEYQRLENEDRIETRTAENEKKLHQRKAENEGRRFHQRSTENEETRFRQRNPIEPVGNGMQKSYSHMALNGGDAQPSSSTAPWTITVSGEGALRCRRGVKNSVKLTARQQDGEPVRLDQSDFTAYLVSSASGRRVSAVAIRESTSAGQYELTYYVNREGSYQLMIKFAGRHIGGSPFPVRCTGDDSGYDYYKTTSPCSVHSSGPLTGSRAASYSSGGGYGGRISGSGFGRRTITTTFSTRSGKSPNRRIPIEDDLLMQCGSHGRAYGQFSNPQGICCTADGSVVIADSNNQCVQVFDVNSGECKLRIGRRGRSPGELQRPTGVAVLPNSGNILVADYDNRWISVHDPNGKYLGRFGAGKLLGPRGIALDADDHVIIVDNKASTIFVYDLCKFKFVRQFGSRGDRLEQLAGPHYCAVNRHTNLLYLTDFHHHCVKVFDCRGQFQFTFGSLGEGNGQFQAPTGIAVDANQNVLVADWGNSRIQIFDHSGSFLSYVNSFVHPLFGPQGLSMTPDGHVVVADTGNHCYKLYRYLS